MPTMRKITDTATIAQMNTESVVKDKIKPCTVESRIESYAHMYHAILRKYSKKG